MLDAGPVIEPRGRLRERGAAHPRPGRVRRGAALAAPGSGAEVPRPRAARQLCNLEAALRGRRGCRGKIAGAAVWLVPALARAGAADACGRRCGPRRAGLRGLAPDAAGSLLTTLAEDLDPAAAVSRDAATVHAETGPQQLLRGRGGPHVQEPERRIAAAAAAATARRAPPAPRPGLRLCSQGRAAPCLHLDPGGGDAVAGQLATDDHACSTPGGPGRGGAEGTPRNSGAALPRHLVGRRRAWR